MNEIVTHVQSAAAITAAILIWTCIDSTIRCNANKMMRSESRHSPPRPKQRPVTTYRRASRRQQDSVY
ncbi:hypothetical protein [Rhodopirellula sp. MGV]|uniref:hypothetical protein n=1 Tax=Rhodopirellula sp. MGV TaxID=2023130 RepID=UPI000B962CA8|nr:hypothetical protein [Rhodopirellula sp. MGV]OYP38251.1 hypothetical protein CGZ80_03280 [Rhodopirellula sp. MGV]PNY38589.1 hypothetical protein C2E31_01335 [Rhodopirellula baltica]